MTSFGTLKADTLTHSTAGSVDTKFSVNGTAKAWEGNNSGGGGSLTAGTSFNISSRTDVDTGKYSLTVTNAFQNSWGSSVDGNVLSGASVNSRVVTVDGQITASTTTIGIRIITASTGSVTDGGTSHVIMWGYLA
tara:strand:+ start:297 stop:701 length:405 start_codon:yes stop_codon:yes gene_type:complete